MGKHLIPESTMQIICSEISLLLNDCYDVLYNKLNQLLTKPSSSDEHEILASSILNCITTEKHENCGNPLLQSTHVRRNILIKDQSFFAPKTYVLNEESNHFFHYIEFEKSIKTLLENKLYCKHCLKN